MLVTPSRTPTGADHTVLVHIVHAGVAIVQTRVLHRWVELFDRSTPSPIEHASR